jgi:hypothetical protein
MRLAVLKAIEKALFGNVEFRIDSPTRHPCKDPKLETEKKDA